MKTYYLKSMTAYGRSSSVFPFGRIAIEIQSVNRRFLEINVGLPRHLMRFEVDIRNHIATRIGRGALNVSVFWKVEGTQPITVTPNLALAKTLKNAWDALLSELDIPGPIPLSVLAQEKDLLIWEENMQEEAVYKKALITALEEALDTLIAMKQREGETLAKDLMARLDFWESAIDAIELQAHEGTEKYRLKLQTRLNDLFSNQIENDERILKEIALYADRVDITEEIVRFKSHLNQFKNLIEKPLANELDTRGKTLDFFLQELLREVNTIGSKAADAFIAQHVVAIKSELEKVREQVQNIE